jgi:hypothetical protein
MKSSNFIGFPGSATILFHVGGKTKGSWHQVLGLSIISPHHEKLTFDGNLEFSATSGGINLKDSTTYILERTEYYFGPCYAIEIGQFNLGASAFILYRNFLNSVESYTISTIQNGTNFIESRLSGYGKGYSFGFAPVVGAQWGLFSGLSVGASIAPPVFNFTGSLKERTNSSHNAPPISGEDELEEIRGSGTTSYNRPMQIRAGLGFEKKKSWSVALDAEYIFSNDETFRLDEDVKTTTLLQYLTPKIKKEKIIQTTGTAQVFNIHTGFEYYLNYYWAIRCGFFITPSNVEEFKKEKNEFLTLRISRIGGSVGIGTESDIGETTFGISGAYGTGETVTGDPWSEEGKLKYEVVEVKHYYVAFFISGAVDFEEMKKDLKTNIKRKVRRKK